MNDSTETTAFIGAENTSQPIIGMTSDIVAAYVSHNSTRAEDIPALIQTVFGALSQVTGDQNTAPSEPLVPAVSIKKSITEDHLICLEDGKKFRSLKRHLGTVYNMTPDEYRTKWGLPSDYPMTAPGYSEVRSRLAKQIGLGQQGAARKQAEPAAEITIQPDDAEMDTDAE